MEELNELENVFTIFYMNTRAFKDALEVENFEGFDAKMLAMSIQNELKDFIRSSEEKIKMIKEINK